MRNNPQHSSSENVQLLTDLARKEKCVRFITQNEDNIKANVKEILNNDSIMYNELHPLANELDRRISIDGRLAQFIVIVLEIT
jgi:hypothetical protein